MATDKLRTALAFLVIVYIVSPVLFKYSPMIQSFLLFMNQVNIQYNVNLSQPEQIGLKCARLLRLEHTPNSVDASIQLGAWHILPESSLPSCTTQHETNRTTISDNLAFDDTRPIILYIHGNGGNRGSNHRSQLYKRLAYEHNYHVITFDYRGYGDSTYIAPNAEGLSSDARLVYLWLIKQPKVTKGRVVVWGHSLGTAVAVRMLADLNESDRPKGLVLEAPFDSIANAVANHPFSIPFRIIPYFDYFFVEPIEKSSDLNFNSANRIVEIKPTSIMILHAEDDAIIPISLGQNLYKHATKVLGKEKVQFVQISDKHGLGHKHIWNHDETMDRVKKFIGNN